MKLAIDNIEDLENDLAELLGTWKTKLEGLKAAKKRTIKYAEFRELSAWALVSRFTDKFAAESLGRFNGSGFTRTPADKSIAKFNKKRDALIAKYGVTVK